MSRGPIGERLHAEYRVHPGARRPGGDDLGAPCIGGPAKEGQHRQTCQPGQAQSAGVTTVGPNARPADPSRTEAAAVLRRRPSCRGGAPAAPRSQPARRTTVGGSSDRWRRRVPAPPRAASTGIHSPPQRAQRTTRPAVTSESGTSYSAEQDGQTIRMRDGCSGCMMGRADGAGPPATKQWSATLPARRAEWQEGYGGHSGRSHGSIR